MVGFKNILAAAAAVSALALASTASAAVFINATDTTGVVAYTGFNGTTADSDIRAELTLTLDSITGMSNTQYNFSYLLRNTSVGDDAGSRITNFGFNTNPNFASASILGGFFDNVRSGNVVAGQMDVEFCATDGNNCTAGGNASGTVEVGETATGTFRLTFATSPGAGGVTLDNNLMRVISLAGGGSGYLVPDDGGGGGNEIPEPGTWALMILGFGAAGSMLRRRRRAFA